MATDAKELEQAKADIAAETATSDKDDLVKSLVGMVDRLTKSGSFGDTDKAHNGNKYDKSAPKGDGDAPDGYDDADDEEDIDGAKGRVARSVSRSRGTNSEMPTTLNKSEGDEDDDEEPAEKSSKNDRDLVKSEADDDEEPTTEETMYKNIAKGKGPAADDYRQVVDASDAIQYLTDQLVKSIAAESKARVESARKLSAQVRAIRKSLAETHEVNVLLTKSMARVLTEQETLAKSESAAKAPKTDGRVVVIAKEDKPAEGEFSKGRLLKSLSRAIQTGKVDPTVAANVTANLDAVLDVKAYWGTLPKTFTDAVAAAGAV